MPPDRHYDVTREVDLIEEVARVHGIDEHLPSTLPAGGRPGGGLSRDQRLRRRAEDAMRDLGFDEIVGWSFTDPGEAERLRIPADDPRAQPVAISNPALRGPVGRCGRRCSARCSTPPGATSPATPTRVALFESGRVYLPSRRRAETRLRVAF